MEDFLLFKVAGCDWIAVVPSFESSTVVILEASILGVLVIILTVFWGTARTLGRIFAGPRFSSAFPDGGAWARMERITICK